MEVLRTPDERFVDLTGYDFAANYVDDLQGYEEGGPTMTTALVHIRPCL